MALGALLSGPPSVQAQAQQDTALYGLQAPGWAGQVTSLSTNVLLGGLTAGVIQELRGGSFKDGFTRGSLGGLFTYAGKRISGRRFDGAGLLGREVAAVGASVIRNASEAQPMFEQLTFPLGPVRLHLRPGARQLHASLDLVAATLIAWGMTEPELELSLEESLSAGTAVFHTNNKVIALRPRGTHAGGVTAASTILLSKVPAWGPNFLDRAAAHERVHVLQEDQLLHTWLEPINDLLITRLPYGRRIARHTDVNWSAELLSMFSGLFGSHGERPWELEAIYLSR